jgi:hypothetical protein
MSVYGFFRCLYLGKDGIVDQTGVTGKGFQRDGVHPIKTNINCCFKNTAEHLFGAYQNRLKIIIDIRL